MATGASMGTTCTLQRGEEFRFEVPAGDVATVTLLTGGAEVFGTEMVANRTYSFSGTQQAVYSWSGCTLEVQGQTGHSYVATETPMASFLQLHGELDQRRSAARASAAEGPRVLIAGPADTGKSSLCRILANYLTRSGHTGTLVDLDLEQGEQLVPGCIAAVPLHRPLDMEGSTEDLAPLAYWLGHTAAAEHLPHLKHLLGSLAHAVKKRHESDASARAGGLLLNTLGWVDGPGYDLLLHVAEIFRADVLIAIGDDRLHSQLMQYAASSPLKPSVVKLAKSGGVISRATATRQAAQSVRISEYFYGVHRELFPHSITLDFAAVSVYSISVFTQAPSSALPIGMRVAENQLASKQLPPALYPSLAYSLLAVLPIESSNCDDLLTTPAAGFVWVNAVDLEKQKINLLAPAPLLTSSLTLLQGSLKWTQER